MFCTKCGKQIPDSTKFCPYCGANCSPEAYVDGKLAVSAELTFAIE